MNTLITQLLKSLNIHCVHNNNRIKIILNCYILNTIRTVIFYIFIFYIIIE
uniref:Uncharacterized protein n=1 Tax=Laurenciella marilzae TaxID=1413812 RepID=A0A1Z1M127_9FLOR|nr:hypothetical protein [Laurenciella marilzae]ARW59779.1 hypothetical protein [Laurenciella marilzae]